MGRDGEARSFDADDLIGTPIARAGSTNDNQENVVAADVAATSIVLVFWGIWCHTCHEELDELAEWYRKSQAENLQILTVQSDGLEHHDRAVEEVAKASWPFDTLLPTNEQLALWNPRGLTPTTIIVEDGSSIIARIVGFGSSERGELFDVLSRFD